MWHSIKYDAVDVTFILLGLLQVAASKIVLCMHKFHIGELVYKYSFLLWHTKLGLTTSNTNEKQLYENISYGKWHLR